MLIDKTRPERTFKFDSIFAKLKGYFHRIVGLVETMKNRVINVGRTTAF